MPAIPRERAIVSGLILATLTTVAGLTASGVTQMVAADLFPMEPRKPSAASHAALSRPGDDPSQRKDPTRIAKAVLTRNMFDPETGSIPWVDPTPPPTPTTDETVVGTPALPSGEPEVCEGDLRLVAAMVFDWKPEWSIASLESGGEARFFRAGMEVEDAQLVGIREQRVFLQPPDKPLCQIVMFNPGAPEPQRSARNDDDDKKRRRPRRRRSRGGLSQEELEQGITKNSDTSYTVTRELIDKALGNQAELMRSARIIPFEENGRTVGVKVYGIRRNSLLGQLGMQNGDVLRTINGFDMTSPDSALEAYTRLRSADNISVSMIRRGKPSTLEYSIR